MLVGITVANDTDRAHDYRVRVRFADDPEATPETVFRSEGTLGARNRRVIDGGWPTEPGRHVVGISVDGGEWHVGDFADRLTQERRICYHQELAIGDGNVAFPVNVDAPCPADPDD